MTARGLAACLAVCAAAAACTGGARAPLVDKGAYEAPSASRGVTIAEGETVHSVARRYGVALPALIAENQLRPPYVIVAGQRLRLPVAETYAVQSGDTLYGISRRYGVDMASLARANGLAAPYVIVVGETLMLPAAARVETVRAPAPPQRAGGGAPAPGAVAAQPAPLFRSDGHFAWPVEGPLLSTFGPKGGGITNDGIDIAAERGTPVLAAESGVVVYAGSELRGLGNLLLIRHADGWITAYAYNERILVGRGESVTRGQPVATAGATGSAETPRVHFEIRRGTRAVDPLQYLEGIAVGTAPQAGTPRRA